MQVLLRLVPVILPLLYISAAAPGTAQKAEKIPDFPRQLTDIDGNVLDIERLARDHNLVVVTLKAPWCPVCHEQLVRLERRLPQLQACDVKFVVLAPGPPEALAAVRKSTGFDYPFVADEGLAVARSLGLAIAEDQIMPCMFQILPTLRLGWRQMGRNGFYFGDRELSEYFDCSRAV